jgi:hypothetical protein
MANLILNGSTSGSVTLSSPAVSGTTTLTLPTTSGTVITTGSTFGGTGPAFSAYASGTQSITTTSFTKIQINTELFDTNSNFDPTTNYRFTPTVAGYYQVNGGVLISIGTTGVITASIYKNGSIAAIGNSTASDSINAYSAISTLLYLNGSSDYVELYGYHTAAGSKSTVAGLPYTYFSAAMIRSA